MKSSIVWRIGRCHAILPASFIRPSAIKDSLSFCGRRTAIRTLSVSTGRSDEVEDREFFYKSVSAYLFRQGRTWKRLSHLLTLASDNSDNFPLDGASKNGRTKSVADVGTDHGLLAMGLALSGNYNKVIGVDISDQALTYGALSLLGKIQNQTLGIDDQYFRNFTDFPIEFRLGSGLKPLESGEADVLCIAGMGVNTMLQILDDQDTSDTITELQRIGTNRLVLQATNSRPRNLILLYDRLQELGWKICDERIEKLSSRWYITASFDLSDVSSTKSDEYLNSIDLPGCKLTVLDKSSSMWKTFDEYCQHHTQWIHKDARASRGNRIDERDLRWLDYFAPRHPTVDSRS